MLRAIRVCLLLLFIPLQPMADTSDSERMIRQFLMAETDALWDQREIDIIGGTARLAQCATPQPFLPSRPDPLWGRLAVGVQCDDGQVRYITAEIRVFGDYLTAAQNLPRGATVQPGMLSRKRGELNRLPARALLDTADALGLVTRHRLAKGAILQQQHLERPLLVKRGQPVQVHTGGRGFRVTLQGEALDAGGTGETVRVRFDRRRVVEARVIGPGKLTTSSPSPD